MKASKVSIAFPHISDYDSVLFDKCNKILMIPTAVSVFPAFLRNQLSFLIHRAPGAKKGDDQL